MWSKITGRVCESERTSEYKGDFWHAGIKTIAKAKKIEIKQIPLYLCKDFCNEIASFQERWL